MYDACMYIWSSILVHVCMMHIPLILTHVIMMHVCMMHISMIIILCMHVINILDPDACVYDLQCMMYISIHISMILDPVACMNVWSLTLMFVCMMHTLLILIQVAMMHICMMHLSTMLDPDTCVYDAQSNDPGPWSWSVYVCMMHLCMILVPDPECMMHVTMHLFPGFVYIWCFLMHVCMMHISIILDPSPWCMYVWCTDVWCTMHKSMILFHDPDDAWIWGGACIYDAVLLLGPTDEPTNKAILGVG